MIKAEGGFKFLKGEKLINSMHLLAWTKVSLFQSMKNTRKGDVLHIRTAASWQKSERVCVLHANIVSDTSGYHINY